MFRFKPTWLLSIVLLAVATGCTGKSDGYQGPRGTVSGKLIVDGRPVPEGCSIMFQAVTGGYVAVATVKTEGKYTLTCQGSFDIPAVEYKVQVAPPVAEIKVKQPSANSTELQNPADIARQVMGPSGSAKVKDSAKPPFGSKYLSTSTSKLTYKVKPGPNTADFDLSN